MTGELLLIFVYGTLKFNQPNHYWLTNPENGIARAISSGKTAKEYPMLIATRYNIPFLLKVPGVGNQINGEIYAINEPMLAKLDELEGHPEFYLREKINIIADDGSNYPCWTYFLRNYPDDLMRDRPLITDYKDSEGKHYIRPEDRHGPPKPLDDLDYRP